MFIAALIVLIVAILLVIAAAFGGGDPTFFDLGSLNAEMSAGFAFFAGMGTTLLLALSLAMFRAGAKRAAARRADRKRVGELSNKLEAYQREERDEVGPDRHEP